MNWFTELFGSTLGKKVVMALTGLFLISFLIIHLIGNLQLLKDDEGHAFNVYAQFMTHNPVIKTISYSLYASIIIHSLWALLLTIGNRTARGTGYAVAGTNSKWASRNMGILGTLILIFIVIHMKQFWYEMHWGPMPYQTYDGEEYKDLYAICMVAFKEPWYVILYTISMVALAFHLYHGFQSAFQTFGLNHPKYTPIIKFVGTVFSIIVPAAFAWMPIAMYLNQN